MTWKAAMYRLLSRVGLSPRATRYQAPFEGASFSRLNMDWATSLLSSDQKLRFSQRVMRMRSRELAQNNDYVIRFLNLARQNVIGRHGIGMEIAFDQEQFNGADALAEKIETAWQRWSERVSTCGQMSWVDFQQAWIAWFLADGETFVKRVKGYPHNITRFALQPIDPDVVDVSFNRDRIESGGGGANEVRMGVELDSWRRPVAYWALRRHPGEGATVARDRIPAEEMDHSFVFKMIAQTRGVPWLHTAMTRMKMLGGYEEAELVASRLAACKMGFFSSETGESYEGGERAASGELEVTVEPGSWEELPAGLDVKTVDWQHPNQQFAEFSKAMLRGAAMGINVSYSSLTGDLRDVNFSSIRQGILDERDGWALLQAFAVDHLCKPVFSDWLRMAVTTGQVELPRQLPVEAVIEATTWTPRGWDWVDPRRDVDADIAAVRAGMTSLKQVCAKRGFDWREVLEQRAKENTFAEGLGLSLDFTTSGAGGVEGDAQSEGSQPATPATPARTKPNGQAPKVH
ncbi:MAG: phage portal protein [Terriglobia bacterium]|nr:phage portal protein [Terriglobia bacterium]